jgi:hypothetical protein
MACARLDCRKNDLNVTNGVLTTAHRHSYSFRHSSKYIVRRQWPPDPLQLELTDRLDLNGVLDLHQHAPANENLTGLGLVAKPRGDVRHRANGGVVEPALEADGAERGEAVRYPDAEADFVAPRSLPKSSPCRAHFPWALANGRPNSAFLDRYRTVQAG